VWLKPLVFMPIHQGMTTVIPCRVTDPRANVQLVKDPNETVTIGQEVTYDPQTGFRVLYPNRFYSGRFRCNASLGNKTDLVEVILYYKGWCCSVSTQFIVSVSETLAKLYKLLMQI